MGGENIAEQQQHLIYEPLAAMSRGRREKKKHLCAHQACASSRGEFSDPSDLVKTRNCQDMTSVTGRTGSRHQGPSAPM
jgi:hypothetical protein